MAHKDTENKIRHAFEAATPDVLDNVLQNCHEQKGTVISMTNKKRNNWIPKVAAAAAMLVLVLGLGLGFGFYQENYKIVSTVSIDVNPSLALHLNSKQVVVEAQAINEDGKIILENKELNGKPLCEAMDTVLDSMIEKGYLNENANSILVSVDSETEEKSTELKEVLNKDVETSLKEKKFDASVITQSVKKNDELKSKAEENNISLGKAKLIERILAQDTRYTFEDLAKLSINELNLLTVSGKLSLDDVTASGTASETKFIGKEAAKAAALAHAELAETDVVRMKIELDCEDGVMIYEVEFHTADSEYEYGIHATTGEVIHSEKEAHPPRDEENKPVLSPEITLIGEEEAVSAALEHAGLETADTVECELDKDHGKFYYEIEIVAGETEYEYLVDAVSGKVIRHQKEHAEQKRPQPETEAAPAVVDPDTVKQTVLAHAGVTEVSEYECELKRDHGKLIYEIEFETAGAEYEYIVDAVSGEIMRFDKEAEHHYVDSFRPQQPQHKPTQNATVSSTLPTMPSRPEGDTKPTKPEGDTKPTQPDNDEHQDHVKPDNDHTAPQQPDMNDHTEPSRPEFDGSDDHNPNEELNDSGNHTAPEASRETRPTKHMDEENDN